MATKFPLNLCEDYVSNWTVQDALREITQNGIDQESAIPNNKMTIKYDKEKEILKIANQKSVLYTNSLLLGKTSKANNKALIGQFGEGYKIALLVLTRLNKRVTIYNYAKGEVWTVRFVESRIYEGPVTDDEKEKVLTVFVDKQYKWSKAPNNDLTFEIEGVTQLEYDNFVERTLQLQTLTEKTDYLSSEQGSILINPKFKGQLYVNGLFLTTSDLHYGYNIYPQFLSIGRDRNLVDSFDVQCITSKMWLEHNSETLKQLVLAKANDVQYIHKHWNLHTTSYIRGSSGYEKLDEVAKDVYEIVQKDNTEDTVFVSSQEEMEEVETIYDNVTTVIVSEQVKDLIERVPAYKEKKNVLTKRTLSRKEQYLMWKRKHVNQYLYEKDMNELERILGLNLGGEEDVEQIEKLV